MFSLIRILGNVPAGALQPSTITIVGEFLCPGGAGGVPLELRVTSPPGGPTTTFTATTSTGAPGTPPANSVTFTIPGWSAAVCGAKIEFQVRGNCGGQWTNWQRVGGEIDCLACPRISLQVSYGGCSGTPPAQTVTLTATIMLPPGASVPFNWEFGDGSGAPAGTVTNSTTDPNTPYTLTTTHAYDAAGGPYTACLEPPAASECPRVCIGVDPDCDTTGCPTIVGTASIGACAANGSRPVTYTLTLSPPAPQNSTVSVSWAYGGANAAGQTSSSQTVSTGAGPVGTVTHTTHLGHRSGGYTTTATVVVLVNGQLCPLANSTVTIPVNPGACLPCPDPARPVTVTVTAPTGASWCAPVQGGQSASFAAQVNWAQPAPATPPSPVRYDWTVTLPDGRVATQSSTGTTVTTATGWSGPGSVNGALDLNGAGSYAIGVAAIFSPSSGLPTDANGTITCQLVGSGTMPLAACPSTTPCPTITGLSTTSGCADPSTGATAGITATATVSDPGGIVQGFVWDFGDPGAPGNQMTTSVPTASHSYATPGSYTVTCRVQTSVACSGTGATTLTATVSIGRCGRPSRIGCDALLWIALILIVLSGILAVIGCIISNSAPQAAAVLGIIAIILLVIGLLLFLLWWAICRFLTACSVIIAAMHFMGIVISVFFIVGVILAFIAKFSNPSMWLCVGVAFFQSGIWGVLLYILYRIAVAVRCITENSGGPPPPAPPSSSSNPLTGSGTREGGERGWAAAGVYRMDRPAGLGDMVKRATEAMGIQPCEACHRRAERLNRWTLG